MVEQSQCSGDLRPRARRLDGHGSPGFCELSVSCLDDQGQVRVTGLIQRERLLKSQLPPRAPKQVATAYHVSDVLLGIVHHDCELIGEEAISSADDEISERSQVEATRSLHPIVERHRPGVIDTKACCRDATSGGAGAARSRITAVIACTDVAPRAGAPVGQTEPLQLLGGDAISLDPLALKDDRPVPLQPKSLECVEHTVCAAWHDPGGVEVFDSQQPVTRLVAGIDKAADGRHKRAKV